MIGLALKMINMIKNFIVVLFFVDSISQVGRDHWNSGMTTNASTAWSLLI
jgi:hypothetical protein